MFFLKKTKKIVEVYSPVDGKVFDVTQSSDQTFSKKFLGDGVLIKPINGEYFSPLDKGIIATVFPTGHAFGFKTKLGPEILVHIGIDTVKLNGEGFQTMVSQGSACDIDTQIVSVDLEKIKENKLSSETPIIVTNDSLKGCKIEIIKKMGDVKRGELLFKIVKP